MNSEALGWWQVMVTLIIGIYYASVLSWAGGLHLLLDWSNGVKILKASSLNTYLQNADGIAFGLVPTLFFGLVIVWAITVFILYGGVKKGVELSNKIFIPLLGDFIQHYCYSSITLTRCNRWLKCVLYTELGSHDQL